MPIDDAPRSNDIPVTLQGKESAERDALSGGTLAALMVAIVILSIPAALVHELAGVFFFGGGLAYLIWKRRKNSADVVGIFLIAFCVSPFLRRIHDLRFGWSPFSTLLLAPYMCFIPLAAETVRNIPRLRQHTSIPIVFVLAGLLWAFLVGLWNFGQTSAIIGAVEWFSGPLFFCYISLSGRKIDYQRLGNWVTPVTLVEAVYGLYQWVSPPLWDARWLVDSDMTSSMGAPFPFMMRTFGTLNSAGTYSLFCAYYLIVGLGWKRYVPVSILVVAALATTLVRASWIVSIAGILLVVFLHGGAGKFKIMRRLGLIGAILCIAGTPLLSKFDSLTDRFATLGNLSNDGSYNARKKLVTEAIKALFDKPEGAGLGAVGRGAKVTKKGIEGLDNGFIAITYMLGWISATLYFGGYLAVAVWSIAKGDPNIPERAAMAGYALVMFASNAFGPSFSDIGGILSWSSLAIAFLSCTGKPPPVPSANSR